MNLLVIIFYQPLFNLLVWIYNVLPTHDLGWAIIILTLLIRIVLYPMGQKSIKSQRALQTIQPKIDALKTQYGTDKEGLGKAMMQLYKDEGINPLSSCLPLLIQFPFLIALYAVFRSGLTHNSFDLLYPFVMNPGQLNHVAFGFFDLTMKSIPLAIAAGLAQFWQTRMLMGQQKNQPKPQNPNDISAMMNKQMIYLMPIMTVFIGVSLPAGIAMYWLATTIFSGIQQMILFRQMTLRQAQGGENKDAQGQVIGLGSETAKDTTDGTSQPSIEGPK
jgi:YidC/Oxa1 family membrane protein insertase